MRIKSFLLVLELETSAYLYRMLRTIRILFLFPVQSGAEPAGLVRRLSVTFSARYFISGEEEALWINLLTQAWKEIRLQYGDSMVKQLRLLQEREWRWLFDNYNQNSFSEFNACSIMLTALIPLELKTQFTSPCRKESWGDSKVSFHMSEVGVVPLKYDMDAYHHHHPFYLSETAEQRESTIRL